MKIINLLPKHLEIMTKIRELSLSPENINVKEVFYEAYPFIYDYLDKEIFHSDQKPSGIFVEALASHELGNLYEIISYWNTHIEGLLLAVQEKTETFFNHETLIDMTICITVGNTACNAIQTPYDGGTVFLFAERLCKDNSAELICHELIHSLHTSIYNGVEDMMLLDLLYIEGVACWFSKMIFPDSDEHIYLYLPKLEDLNDRQAFILKNAYEILQDLQSEDSSVFGNYLNASQRVEGRALRIGYDIGFYVVEDIWKGASSLELLKMDVNTSRLGFIDSFKRLYLS